jgi:non-specific serine/threonine protein kinase
MREGPSDLADPDRLQRFSREAKAASSLNHPNVATIYDIGEYGGISFISMEYVEGQTLARRINGRPMGPAEIVEIGKQMADALDAAHAKGIIHRDIKPGNIMLTPRGRVKVLDFGLAKITRHAAETLAGEIHTAGITTPGLVMGSVQYMSPEQVLGRNVGHRSDIFSLGVVLYEMATGHLPFAGPTLGETLDRILHAEPHPIVSFNETAHSGLPEIILKCLEKEPERRYPSAQDLFNDLSSAAFPRSDHQPSSKAIASIAVLPFVNMSADPENSYFCDGLAEELINALTKIEGLRVAARTSSFSFRTKDFHVREIGQKLNVRTVLEGSVRRAGNRLRIAAQLINVADGYHLWSEKYERLMEDLFAVQDELALTVPPASVGRLRDCSRY